MTDTAIERRRRPRLPATGQVPLLICGDHPLCRTALSCLIRRDSRFRVVAESSNDIDGLRAGLEQDPRIVLIDLDGPVTMLETLLDCISPRPAIVIAPPLDADACQRAMRRGASGIVFKTSDAGVLFAAIDTVYRGQVWLDRSLVPQLFNNEPRSDTSIALLTPREREIVRVACTGVTNKEIATALRISDATVRHHLGSIFAKLGVTTRSELVGFAYRNNLAA
jgi:DNA-binding NarL/FixJ family response regulator